ncbi:MAG: secretin N-terminal domain-containing protein [Planctomycetota bacterium]
MNILCRQRPWWVHVIGVIAVGSALLSARPATAQGFAGFEGDEDMKVTGRISIDFKDEPLENVVDTISRMVGVNVVLAPGVEERLTLRLVNVHYDQVLNEIAGRCNLIVQKEAENLIRLANPPRVTITFQEADIKTAIDMLARQADVNIVVAAEVEGKVNMRLKNIPWREALQTVVKTAGFVTVVDEMGIMRVVTRASLVEQLETKAFHLRYIQPPSIYTAQIDTEFAVGKPKQKTGEYDRDFTLFKALQSVISDFGKVEFDADTNAVIVSDIPPKLAEIEAIIKQLDIEPLQVFCDIKFVTTTNTDLLDFGADWTLGGVNTPGISLTGLGDFAFFFGSGRGADSSGNTYRFGKADTFDVGILPTEHFPLAVTNPLTGSFVSGNIGILDFNRMRFAMNFVKNDDKSNIIQAPKLFVLDNQEATIFVGQTIRFAETFTTTVQGTAGTSGIREADNSPVETGFQLLLKPHVIREANQIIITIIPEWEFLSGPDADGFQTFNDGVHTIRLPQVTSNTVITRIKMDSGQTAVMGGMIQERDVEFTSKLPILGDLPIVGWLFKNKQTQKRKENLLIFITCTIVDRGQETRGVVAEQITSANENRVGKPLFLKDRIRRDMEEELDKEVESRRAYEKQFRASEYRVYQK